MQTETCECGHPKARHAPFERDPLTCWVVIGPSGKLCNCMEFIAQKDEG